ncbi:MAG: hypothetical protein Q7J06_07645 [Bacteroidales bacterium]|nr:hypothetical protein [Bacteroidales bacterium]
MKRTVLLVLVFLSLASYSFAKEYKVNSPDNRISLVVNVGSDIKWSASLDGKEIINSTKVAIRLADGKILDENSSGSGRWLGGKNFTQIILLIC